MPESALEEIRTLLKPFTQKGHMPPIYFTELDTRFPLMGSQDTGVQYVTDGTLSKLLPVILPEGMMTSDSVDLQSHAAVVGATYLIRTRQSRGKIREVRVFVRQLVGLDRVLEKLKEILGAQQNPATSAPPDAGPAPTA